MLPLQSALTILCVGHTLVGADVLVPALQLAPREKVRQREVLYRVFLFILLIDVEDVARQQA